MGPIQFHEIVAFSQELAGAVFPREWRARACSRTEELGQGHTLDTECPSERQTQALELGSLYGATERARRVFADGEIELGLRKAFTQCYWGCRGRGGHGAHGIPNPAARPSPFAQGCDRRSAELEAGWPRFYCVGVGHGGRERQPRQSRLRPVITPAYETSDCHRTDRQELGGYERLTHCNADDVDGDHDDGDGDCECVNGDQTTSIVRTCSPRCRPQCIHSSTCCTAILLTRLWHDCKTLVDTCKALPCYLQGIALRIVACQPLPCRRNASIGKSARWNQGSRRGCSNPSSSWAW